MIRAPGLAHRRSGATLVELMAASALMCVVLGMAAACLHPAAVAIRRTERLQDAWLILDTVLSELRLELEGSYGYLSIAAAVDSAEFENGRGETVQLSARRCEVHYGEAFFRGMHLALEFSPPQDAPTDEPLKTVYVTAALYRDAERTDLAARETRLVQLRHGPVLRWETATE